MNYYNDNDPFVCQWTENLIAANLIPGGKVDCRPIQEIEPDDLRGYKQCHFFSGIAGWSHALQLAGWDPEREVWTGSCPCFPAGTLVITATGYKPIETVVVGDQVLTHKGRFRPVTHIGSETAACVRVKGQGHWGMICTPNHPFLVENEDAEEWLPAEQLQGKRWANVAEIPAVEQPPVVFQQKGYFFDKITRKYRVKGEINGKEVYIGLYDSPAEAQAARARAIQQGQIKVRGGNAIDISTLAFAKLLGYWVGDGWVSGDHVYLCGAKNECWLLDQLFAEASLTGKAYVERTASRIRCGSKALTTWLRENFGEGADGKRIPVWLHSMSLEYRWAFLSGYFMADGHDQKQKHGGKDVKVFTTTSRALAVGVRILLNQSGFSASVRLVSSRRRKQLTIEGRSVKESPYYKVTAYETARSFRFSGGHGWGLVRSVEPTGTHRVYNLAVAGDESYTADGIVVHNCQPFSHAGRKKGTQDERHLWPHFYRLIQECKPDTIFGEQVASPDGREWVDGVCAQLEDLGYQATALDLCSPCVGAPHIRQRLYWVAVANRPRVHPPGPGQSPAAPGRKQEEGHQRQWLRPDPGHGRAPLPGGLDDARCPADECACRSAEASAASGKTQGEAQQRQWCGHAPGSAGTSGPWDDATLLACRDGKTRRAQSGLQLLVDGVSFQLADGSTWGGTSHAGLLRAFGNAIVPQLAALFIECFLEAEQDPALERWKKTREQRRVDCICGEGEDS